MRCQRRRRSCGALVKQALTRCDTREIYRLCGDLDVVTAHPRHRVARGRKIRCGRMVFAEMRPAAVGSRLRRRTDGAADLNEVFEIEAIGPGQVIAALAVRYAAADHRLLQV